MKGHFSQKQRNPQSNKPTRYPTQDCKSVFLERESEREGLVPMVAGKVRMAMGLQNSLGRLKQETPPPKPPLPSLSSAKVPQKAVFSHSFGVYFPRSSTQVQPRPLDVTELLRLVEELHERESLLKIERAAKQINDLEVENRSLRADRGDDGEDDRARKRRKEMNKKNKSRKKKKKIRVKNSI
jgi:hypothetical protein